MIRPLLLTSEFCNDVLDSLFPVCVCVLKKHNRLKMLRLKTQPPLNLLAKRMLKTISLCTGVLSVC